MEIFCIMGNTSEVGCCNTIGEAKSYLRLAFNPISHYSNHR